MDPDVRTRIVMFSGGVTSWAAAVRCIERYGRDSVVLAFADTMTENDDLYAFVSQATEQLGVPLHTIRDGRNVWEVFRDVRFLGNTRIDPCSRVLKRDALRTWLNENFTPDTGVVVLGMDWTEGDRIAKTAKYWTPWTVEFPLSEPPYIDKEEWIRLATEAGLPRNRLYDMSFMHANCGGFCIKAGQGQFAKLLEHFPDTYAYHEQEEQNLRTFLGKDIAILRDRRGGTTKPMTMKTFRERIQGVEDDPSCELPYDPLDIGGCGCMTPGEDEDGNPYAEIDALLDVARGTVPA